MYRDTWDPGTDIFGSGKYSFLDPVTYYMRKAAIINKTFNRSVIGVELQAEPWAPIMDTPLQKQLQSMNPDMFQEGVAFGRETGLKRLYFWGAEWWYWMKTKENQPQIWDEARAVFR